MRAQVLQNEVSPTEVLSPAGHAAAKPDDAQESVSTQDVANRGGEDFTAPCVTAEGVANRDAVSPNDAVASLARFAASYGGDAPPGLSSVGQISAGIALKSSAHPKCLLSESVHHGDGSGPAVALDEYSGKLLVVTLGITDVVERTGLTVSIWGSADQIEWGETPLLTFRQRQYCGVYSVLLNMAAHPGIRYLRVQWNMNRWGKGARNPLFGFEVFLEESGARVSTSAVA
jgi:hypothetical protein